MSKTYTRILAPINTREPKGHCQAVNERNNNALRRIDKQMKQETKG